MEQPTRGAFLEAAARIGLARVDVAATHQRAALCLAEWREGWRGAALSMQVLHAEERSHALNAELHRAEASLQTADRSHDALEAPRVPFLALPGSDPHPSPMRRTPFAASTHAMPPSVFAPSMPRRPRNGKRSGSALPWR